MRRHPGQHRCWRSQVGALRREEATAGQARRQGKVCRYKPHDSRQRVNRIEPTGNRLSNSRRRQHPLNSHRPPVRFRHPKYPVRLIDQCDGCRPLVNGSQREPHPAGPAGAAARREDQVRAHSRIVEVGLAAGEPQAAAHDFPAAFLLLERHVDALVSQAFQRTFDALAGNERPKVTEIAADMAQQSQIRAGVVAVNSLLDDRQETLLAVREAIRKPLASNRERDWISQEQAEIAREAR